MVCSVLISDSKMTWNAHIDYLGGVKFYHLQVRNRLHRNSYKSSVESMLLMLHLLMFLDGLLVIVCLLKVLLSTNDWCCDYNQTFFKTSISFSKRTKSAAAKTNTSDMSEGVEESLPLLTGSDCGCGCFL